MPPSVTVAAFAFGMALLLAAIIGKEIKIVAIELPALKGATRVVIGALGVALLGVGLLDLRPAPAPASPPTTPTIAATSAPAPVATPPTPPTSALAAPAGRVVFFSDFDQDRGDWATGSEINERGAVTRLVSTGKYQWSAAATNHGGYQMALARAAPALADFELQAEARQLSGDAFYGLIFRNTGRDGYYLFLVRGRDFALYRIDGQGQTVLLSQADSPAIKRDAVNVLKVVAAGQTILLYIDNTLVGETGGARPAAGTTGLYVNVPGSSQAAFEFDNFLLSSLAVSN